MVLSRFLAIALATNVFIPTQLAAQAETTSNAFSRHLRVEYGLQLYGASAYRTAMSPELTDYVVSVRFAANPFEGFRANVAARLNQSHRFSLTWYGSASTLERNRFYGFGNDNEPHEPAAFYHLDQLLVESGLTTRLAMRGQGNFVAISPFYRFWNTDSDVGPTHLDDDQDTVDDGGIVQMLQPYGVGRFGQFGVRVEAHGGTRGPETGAPFGIRFDVEGVGSPKMLDSRDATLSLLAHIGTFVRVPFPSDPILFVHARAHRVFGDAPFQDAAYLGGRRTLKGFKKQQFAGDMTLVTGAELHATAMRLSMLKRTVTIGPLGLLDIGRVYHDGASPGSWHVGVGGGLWLRDLASGRQINIALARGDIGPRFYITIGNGMRP